MSTSTNEHEVKELIRQELKASFVFNMTKDEIEMKLKIALLELELIELEDKQAQERADILIQIQTASEMAIDSLNSRLNIVKAC